jgi:hypothetical protein
LSAEAKFSLSKGLTSVRLQPSTIKPSRPLVAAASVSVARKLISVRSLPVRPWASGCELFPGYFDLETRVTVAALPDQRRILNERVPSGFSDFLLNR